MRETHLDQLAATLAGLIQTNIAAYADRDPIDLLQSCRRNLDRSLQALSGDLEDPADLIDAPAETGRARARQQVPLEAMLHAYRLGGRVLWEAIVREARLRPQAVDAGRLLDAATSLWQVIDTHSAAAAAAYNQEESARRRSGLRRQQMLLDSLLEGQGGDPLLVREAADSLRMVLSGPLMVVVAAYEPPDPEPLLAPEEALAVRGIRSSWQVRSGQEIGLVAPDGVAAVAAREVLRGCAVGRVACSPVVIGAAAVGHAFRLAELALRTVPSGHRGLVDLDDRLPEALLVSSPELSAQLRARALGPVLALRSHERAALLSTLAAVLRVGGSPSRAADELFCHRNTVLKRLRRIEVLTGLSTSGGRDRLLLELAVLAVELPGGLEQGT